MASDLSLLPVRVLEKRVWDVAGQTWAAEVQSVINTDTLNATIQSPLAVTGTFFPATQPVSLSVIMPLFASGQATGSGNTTLVTPSAGKKLCVFYCSYNPLLAVEAAFRFGAAGSLWLRNSVTANSVIAKEFGVTRVMEGAVDEPLILNLSLGVATNWNVFYREV